MLRWSAAVVVPLALASATLAAATSAGSAVAAPTHTLVVAGAGVGMYPAFAADIERYAVTTTAATAGTVTVTASTTDPDGAVLVNGELEPDGTATVTGLDEGDEISVFISDSSGTERHALVYLPAEFPELRVVTRKAGIAPGYVGLTLTGWAQKPSPAFETAVDSQGVPVYVNDRIESSLDLKRAANGHYTVSRPTTTPGRTGMKLVELDDRFNKLAEYETVGLTDTNGHDSILRPDGSRVLVGYENDADTGLIDGVIQEVDPAGEVVFTWNSGHVPGEDLAAETVSDKSNGDDFHLNSIWQTADGNLIASFRHLSAVLKIDWRTDDGDGRGGIIWKLGGRDSDFTFVDDPYPGGPCAQHTASELPNGHILIFDNGSAWLFHSFCIDPADPWGATVDRPFTRVTEYALDVGNGTATLVRQLAPPDRFGFFGGSASRLANGNTLLGWSSSRDAVATEVGPTGEVLWEIKTLPIDPSDENVFFSTYRAAKFAVPDLVAPQVAVAVPAQGATYSLGSTVPSRFACTDRGGSSLHSCDGTAASRASVDTTTVGAHTFTVTATDGSGNTSVVTRTYTVADRPHLPDAMVRVAGGRGWVGADVHGPAGSQSVTAAIPDPRASVTVQVRLQNDGTVTDQIAVLGTGSGHAFSVIYRVAGVDVTRRVLAGTYRTPGLEPGERVTLRAIVTRTAAAPVGASRRFRVLGRSAADPAVRDAVAWKVTATR